jgi:hypothetical protein
MRYWGLLVLGLTIVTAAILLVCWGFYHVMLIGTCASGGPYVSARPCPPGTGGHALALTGGIVAIIIGWGVVAARGDGPLVKTPAFVAIGWALSCWLPAFAGLLAAYGPAATGGSGAKLGAAIACGVLILLGLPSLLLMFSSRFTPGRGT